MTAGERDVPASAPDSDRTMLSRAWDLGRWVVAVALMAWLATMVDWRQVSGSLSRLSWWLVAAALAASLATRLLTAVRWHVAVRSQLPDVGLPSVVRMTFVSTFLSSFLVSGLGTDVTRAVLIGRAGRDRVRGVSSIVVDRLTGMWVLLGLGACMLAFGPVRFPGRDLLLALTGGVWLASILGPVLLLALRERGLRLVRRVPGLGARLAGPARRLVASLREYGRQGGLMTRITVLALAINGLRILVNYLWASALGSTVPLAAHAVFIPIIFATNQIPISVDSLGVREGLYVYLFGLVGMPAGTALSVALLTRVGGYLISLPGGVLYARHGFGPRGDRSTGRGDPPSSEPEGSRWTSAF